MEKQRWIEAGRIVNTHGVRGAVKILSWLDSPEALASFRRLYVEGKELRVLAAHVRKGCVIVSFEGVSDVNAAMELKNQTVYIRREDAVLPEGVFFYADILGARVVNEDGEDLGALAEVLDKPAQRIYVVRGQREHLIPAVPEFVLRTDVEAGVITVRLIEGM